MASSMDPMPTVLQNALDDLVSSRSSKNCKDRSLETIGCLLASICVSGDPSAADNLDSFLSLQDAFECNIATRLMGWISHNTFSLETYISRETEDRARPTESTALMSQLTQALTIIQGVALVHKPSKLYLGRKYSLEVLVDLISTTRRVTTPSSTPDHKRHKSVPSVTTTQSSAPVMPSTPHAALQSAILDTLCCILVDSPAALRHFEEADGLSVISKLIRRSSTPKEVRIKCIEFLVFYVMDETESASVLGHEPRSASEPSRPVPTAPSTPTRPRHKKSRSLVPSSRSGSQLDPFLSTSGYSSTSSLSDAESFTSVESTVGPRTPEDDDIPIHRPLAELRKESDRDRVSSPKKEFS
ncbi:hypothetical protein NEOLEDRAFT_1215077 [Neolentinus lepideus HHB14362 ss-1]|uniref:Cell division control 14, SIN component n=1 Tax=Neolentinus lepideus HHB14362 ss-1 TaxID=1314782 RepID=A0A165VAF5_9AGAM|nr:hypothetical protein NEOLEDRAFT_1215077 [Neolentinus lepideus HHB14362 ss-1]